jgi:hypothetical protein
MARKLREWRADLRRAGATIETQRGSHQKWGHPWVPDTKVILSGPDSADAHPYQEKQVRRLLQRIHQERQKRTRP